MTKKKEKGYWLPIQIVGEPGRHWRFFVRGNRMFVRYYIHSANGKALSTGHWLTENEDRLKAALLMNTELTKHQVVCTIVRNDMKHWKEDRTKDKFRKIVRTGS